MAFTTTPYTDIPYVKLVTDKQSTADDDYISKLILAAQSFLDQMVGYSFQTDGTVQTPATRTYSGANTTSLMIDDCVSLVQVQEIQQVSSIGANGVWQLGNILTIDITADTILGPQNMTPGFLLTRISDNLFYRGKKNYTVKGVFGQPAIPPEISHATARIVAQWLQMRDTNYTDTIAETGFVHMRFKKDLPDDVMQIISSYRRTLTLSSWGE